MAASVDCITSDQLTVSPSGGTLRRLSPILTQMAQVGAREKDVVSQRRLSMSL